MKASIHSTFICIFLSVSAFAQATAIQIYQQGIYAEEVQGDLEKALAFYSKVIHTFPNERLLVAKALLQSGLCYEKLGRKQATQFYQKILDEYPDQWQIARIARANIVRLEKSTQRNSNAEIVRYYLDRLGIDILTATSFDDKYLAFTDWTTGNLMVKDLLTWKKQQLTKADWSDSPEFALRPVWSRDGKRIAYSWYRQPYFTELRIVDIKSGISQAVYSDSEKMIAPEDWSPDGTAILCLVGNLQTAIPNRLVLVFPKTATVKDLLSVDPDSRGIMFSPDGKYIAYDMQHDQDRQIFVLDIDNSRSTQITSGLYGRRGYDAPIWSRDGKFMFFRSFRLGQYDLWELAVQDGKATGEPGLVQSDLTNAILAIKGIGHNAESKESKFLNDHIVSHLNRNKGQSFTEDFSSLVLDSSWFITEWNKQNVYDYRTFGRYSLSDHPGHLRYYLDPIMSPGYLYRYSPVFSGWYWCYPGLEINRIIDGDFWELEAKVTYSMVDGVNGRDLELVLCFDPLRDRETALLIVRGKDINHSSNRLRVQLLDRGEISAATDDCRAPGDTLGTTHFTYIFRISRADTAIEVALSDNGGLDFHQVLSGTLCSDLRGLAQLLILTGNSWFAPAGSYADWDYIRFQNSDF